MRGSRGDGKGSSFEAGGQGPLGGRRVGVPRVPLPALMVAWLLPGPWGVWKALHSGIFLIVERLVLLGAGKPDPD